ncbi:MAG: hypothetical protein AAFR33_11250 [Pseudomonadota bacterium]
MQAFGQIQGGKNAAAAGRYNKEAAYREAESLEIQAQQEVAVASINAQRIKKRADEIMAQNRVAAAAGGGSTLDASVVAVSQEAVKNSTLDQLLLMAEGEQRGQDLEYQAEVTRAGGRYEEWQGKQRRTAGYISAAGTILQSAGSMGASFGSPSGGTLASQKAAKVGKGP